MPQNNRLFFTSTAQAVWEIPFWLLLTFSAFFPASWVPLQEWFGIPLRISDAATLLIAAFYGIVGTVVRLVSSQRQAVVLLLPATLLLGIYGWIRLWTGPLELEDQAGMSYALLLFLAGPVQAVGLLGIYNAARVRGFLNRLVIFLGVVCVLYTAESLLGLGLRTEAGNSINSDFGIQRVRGPLFGSSTGYLLLLPALGWSLFMIWENTGKKALAFFSAASLMAAYLGLGSRAGLILLGMFLTLVLIEARKSARSWISLCATAILCAGIGAMIYSRADTQRLSSFADQHRQMTYGTAWNVLQMEPADSLLLGQGYGSIWNWYRRDILNTGRIAMGDNLVLTGFGPSLYHSHSTILELLIEFGIFGIAWLVLLSGLLWRNPWIGKTPSGWRIFSFALALTIFGFAFDLFLFKEARVSSLWWIFVFASFQQHSQWVRRNK